jgi:hypothetical protein
MGQYNTRYQDEAGESANAAPVDTDPDGALLTAALEQRKANGQMLELNPRMPFRDSVPGRLAGRLPLRGENPSARIDAGEAWCVRARATAWRGDLWDR